MHSLALKTAESITIRDAHTNDVTTLIALGKTIWNMHYPGIISREQIDYMLAQFYTPEAFTAQIGNPECRTFLLHHNDAPAGFAQLEKQSEAHWHIHKFYIDTKLHGTGLGSTLMAHILKECAPKKLTLLVNRKNFSAINFYFSRGFSIDGIRDGDIGSGFATEDFYMKREQRHG